MDVGRRESARTSRDGSCVAWQRGLVKNWRCGGGRHGAVEQTGQNCLHAHERAKERSDPEMQEGQKLTPLRYSCTYEVGRVFLCGVTGPRASHAHLSANLVQLLFHLKRPRYRTATTTFMLRPWCCRTLPTWLSRATTSVVASTWERR